MIEALKFVRNAIASKGFAPELTFFRIRDGSVTGFNGSLAISSPIPIDLDIAPHAAEFMRAINACDGEVVLKIAKGKLQVISGTFKTFVDCVEVDTVPVIIPHGNKFVFQHSILDCFKLLVNFMGTDQNRPWSNGILLKNQSAFATNNIAMIENWLGCNLPLVNIPSSIVNEVLDYGQEPAHALITNDRITFIYENGKWISSALLALEWPDITRFFTDEPFTGQPFPSTFFEGIDKLSKFGDKLGRCYFNDDLLSTNSDHENEGASVECQGVHNYGIYNVNALKSLQGVATSIDFTCYPEPCNFIGERVRGVIVGYRKD
jgi:hypothetical protein